MASRPPSGLPQTRSYQEEMLKESLKRNIIVAMDTGSGKTHIAVLRIQVEAEREPSKISWFLVPTVALCEQQRDVIDSALPVPVGLISGAQVPDQWTNPQTWEKSLKDHRVIVSTPQVLLDALRHGYVNMASHIGLLIFDEAHHAADKHPYNVIMREFYDKCTESTEDGRRVRPLVLGLTASPMFGGNVAKAFEKLEVNLDSVILTPRATRHDLMQHVHRPKFTHVRFPELSDSAWKSSRNTLALERVYKSLNIENDPYVLSLRKALERPQRDDATRNRTSQRLSKALDKKDTFVHKGMRDFLRCAKDLCRDLGTWAADWYIASVVHRALKGDAEIIHQLFVDRKEPEKAYLIEVLKKIEATSPDPQSVSENCSAKANVYIECLLKEKSYWKEREQEFSGLTFITRRDGALALSTLINLHPQTRAEFVVGTLLGGSEGSKHCSLLDITHTLLRETQSEVLSDFRVGERNLVISTAVAEEGIDIQACCSVIRWDPPANMVSWAQSRGRARRQSSSLILMAEEGGISEDLVRKWETIERQMVESYNNEERLRKSQLRQMDDDGIEDDEYDEFALTQTGAKVTLDSALSHIAHFCNVLPALQRSDVMPVYDFSPPDYAEGYHLLPSDLRRMQTKITGPFGATLTLPRLLPPELRVFKTEEIHPSKKAAQKRVAFEAYKALYEAHLLNENLLPLGTSLNALQDEEVRVLLKDVLQREGVTNVLHELDPWCAIIDADSQADGSVKWWSNLIKVDGLRPYRMFTRRKIAQIDFSLDVLHDPKYGARRFQVTPGKAMALTEQQMHSAKQFTRRIFSVFYERRMDKDSLDFSYLFLPEDVSDVETVWEGRRQWAESSGCQPREGSMQKELLAGAREYGSHYDHPLDIHILASGGLYHFKEWRFERVTPDEEAQLRKKYSRYPNFKLEYPALVGERILTRRDFLVPATDSPRKTGQVEILLPQFSYIVLDDESNITFALLLPSILRAMFIKLTAQAFKEAFLDRISLRKIQLSSIQNALVAPSANSAYNYERLESVGDAVLKFVVSIHLFQAHQSWPEGYLSRRKDHAVSNACLAKAAIDRRVFKWIVRRGFSPKKWSPNYSAQPASATEGSTTGQQSTPNDLDGDENEGDEEAPLVQGLEDDAQDGDVIEKLSTKILADVVEALNGAAYISGGFDCSIEYLDTFKIDIGTQWQCISDCISSAMANIGVLEGSKSTVDHAERILGYVFNQKMLAVEALMHVTSISSIKSTSYERLEFIGDALLDVIVIDALFRADRQGKAFTPGELHLRKAAIVNTHLLAFLCLRAGTAIETEIGSWDYKRRGETLVKKSHTIWLSNCIDHASHQLTDKLQKARTRFNHAKQEIEQALENGKTFPWAALAQIRAPKVLSDVIESLLGAVYLDSCGDLSAVTSLLEKIGFMRVLERLISEDIELLHPISRVMEWAGKHHVADELEMKMEKTGDRAIFSITLHGDIIHSQSERFEGKESEEALKLRVAEEAIGLLESRHNAS